VKPGENLFELGADSLDVVEVIMSLEFEFDIEIPDHLIGDESALKVESLFGIVDKLHPKGAASAEVGLTTEAS
jgi:acyl carrier protein